MWDWTNPWGLRLNVISKEDNTWLGVEMKVLPQSVYKEISLKFFTTLLGIPLTCGKVFYSITYLNLNHYIVFFFFFFEWLDSYGNDKIKIRTLVVLKKETKLCYWVTRLLAII